MPVKKPSPADLEPIERAPRAELQALQLERLRWSLDHAYRNVPHYRAKFDAAKVKPAELNSLADLAKFPFTAKADLREKGKAAGLAGGMFGGAGLVALYGVGALTAAAILALATALDGWLAALIVGLGVALFGVPILGSLTLLAALSALFITTNLSVGYTFSTIAQNQLQAMQMTFFFFLPSMLLSGFMFPFRGMPGWAQVIGEALPLTHFLRIVRGVLLKGSGLADIAPDLVPENWQERAEGHVNQVEPL